MSHDVPGLKHYALVVHWPTLEVERCAALETSPADAAIADAAISAVDRRQGRA